MAMFDIIEFFDDSGNIMVARVPRNGSGEFRLGSQLVVQENQVAFFARDGRMLDEFSAGRYTLSTQNLPLLTSLLALPFGGKSPFRCYAYYLSTSSFPGLGWGTPSPVIFRDNDLRMVNVRAFGVYSMRISKPRLFMETLVGTKGLETTFELENFLRAAIVSRFMESLGKILKSILDLPLHYGEIALATKSAVRLDFEQYGVELTDLLIEAITVPPEVQEMLNRASGIAAQDPEKYKTIATADALRDAARNPGGTGEGLGTGLGLGIGIGMAKSFSESMAQQHPQQAPAPAQTAPSTPQARLTADELRAKLKELKQMKDDGLITDADFEEQKRRLLSQF